MSLSILKMLKERSVVLDLERFRCGKNSFLVRKLDSATSDYSDSLIFLPPASFNSLPKSEQKAYSWLKNNLRGIHWESDDYLYLNLNQIIQSFVLRNTNIVIYAKKKRDLLATYMDQKVENLDELGCPRIENLHLKNYPACSRHFHHNHSRNHCALKRSKAFLDRLKNEQQRETSEIGDLTISKLSFMCLDESRE